jgi:hypothetical protein
MELAITTLFAVNAAPVRVEYVMELTVAVIPVILDPVNVE